MTPRVREEYADARRRSIIEAAKRVFVRKGLAATTVHDIAAEAEISAGSLYNYFEGKDALVDAVWTECSDEFELIFDRAAEADSPIERFAAAGEAAMGPLRDADARERAILILQLALASARDAELGRRVRASRLDTERSLAAMVVEAQRSGVLAADVDPQHLAQLLVAMVAGLHTRLVEVDEPLDVDGLLEVALRLVGGLRTDAGRENGK